MTKRIFKYRFEISGRQKVVMIENAKPIHVGLDPQDEPCIWAEVEDRGAQTYQTEREICVVGTGHPMPDLNMKHIGTIVGDPFVWHVYEILN